MQVERWRQIESVFQSALEQPPEARDAYLEEVCHSDSSLREEVAVLLAAHEQTNDPLDTPALNEALRLLGGSPALASGDRVGRFTIVSRLGAGGMGEVYLARDPQLGRKVAIKVLPAAFAVDKERVRRVYHEGRTASALNHPNILTVYDVGETRGRPYLATEFVDGATLRARLREGPISVDEAVRVASQAASALQASHNAGILHRDIKPENLMVRPDGLLKVLDFGIAKVMPRADGGSASAKSLTIATEQGRIAGSIFYMSPEQISGHELDARTDLWSLGVVLYEMVTGSMPFSGPTPSHVTVAILESDMGALPASVPANIRAVLEKTLVKDRNLRYSSAEELINDLRAPVISSVGAQPPHRRNALLRNRVPVALILFVAVVAVLLYALPVWRTARETSPLFERMLPLTNTGDVVNAAISRDGKYLAFATDSGQRQGLWLQQVSTKSNQLRVSTHDVTWRGITFSPDNNYLYYVLQAPSGEGVLWRLPVIGGAPRSLIRDVDGSVALSPDGSQIAFLRGDPSRGVTLLMLASSDGSNERQLAVSKSSEGFLEGSLSWSPDANAIAAAMWRSISSKRKAVITATRVSSGEQRPLSSSAWTWVEALQWLDRAVFLVGTKDDTAPASQVFRIRLDNDAIVTATSDAGRYSNLSVTADGDLATVQTLRTAAIWVSSGADLTKAQRRTPAGSQYFGVTWADERHLLARANVAGVPEIWRIAAEGDSTETLTDGPFEQRYARVCGGGPYIVFSSAGTGSWKVWRMDADGKNHRQLTTGTSTDGNPVCTPDGRWVIFNSDQSGKTTLWRVSIEGGVAQQLTSEVSYHPEVSPDGNWIVCRFLDSAAARAGSVAVLPISGGAPSRRLKGIPGSSQMRWGPRENTISYVRTAAEVSNLFAQGILDGSEQQLTRFESDQIFAFDWTRDFSRLATIRGVDSRNAVILTQSGGTVWRKR